MVAPRFVWRLIQVGPRIAYALGLGPLIGSLVLLSTTMGRKPGRPRTTPLVYEERDGVFYVASARGPVVDWVRNIEAEPIVHVRAGRRDFDGRAEAVSEYGRMADYLERQMKRNQRLFGAALRIEGLPSRPTPRDLEGLARRRPMVAIRPVADRGTGSATSPAQQGAEEHDHV